jgi:phage terminase Nu1 subunit (DNA packaging protein)
MPLMTFAAYSRHRGVSKQAVTKAIAAGRISVVVENGKRFVDSDVADVEWERNSQHDQRRIPIQDEDSQAPVQSEGEQKTPATEGPSGTQSYTKNRAVREHYNARLAKLSFEQRSGKLVEEEQVKKEAFVIARRVRDSLLAIPDRVAAELVNEPNQFRIHARLTEEIRKALISLKDLLNNEQGAVRENKEASTT